MSNDAHRDAIATIPRDEYLTTEEVAAWLKVAPSTVCRWRLAGRGPRVTWLSPSPPRYRRTDIAAWLDAVAA
ncbi:helix-turn-helix transcriptional regulator [Isoptericola jiangsuensis]|uniref:helix-turn-helix transcriptional regulator n=1 Tax=Isoptericola jiangsuensis TaxID=548579 RepID=UPI003AAFEFC7